MSVTIKKCNLRKTEILRKKVEFNRVFASTKILSSPSLALRYAESPTRKIGFIVSKEVTPKAVMRNQLKRYLREIYRNNKELFPENYCYVLQIRESGTDKSLHELRDEILSLVGKINGKK